MFTTTMILWRTVNPKAIISTGESSDRIIGLTYSIVAGTQYTIAESQKPKH